MSTKSSTDSGSIVDATSRFPRIHGTDTIMIQELQLLDSFCTPLEERFERLTRLGKRALNMPVAAITTVSQDIQWFKSVFGWTIAKLPINESLCEEVIQKAQAVVRPDLQKSLEYASHSLVVGGPGFRSYAGVPLRNARGTVIGTFCVMDFISRKLDRDEYQTLLDIAELAQRELLTHALHGAQSSLIAKLSVARRQALIDPLTKTWNRRGGLLLLDESVAAARSAGESLAVLSVDLNDFKSVNDEFGHPIGDKVLKMVARTLSSCVRDSDGVCRWGGDEFVVVMMDIAPAGVQKIVDRLCEEIARSEVPVGLTEKATVSVSVGVAHVSAGSSLERDRLLAAADAALYEKKSEARDVGSEHS